MLTRIFLFVGISSLCLASARAQVTYETYEFLPLAVGNSWVFRNDSHDKYGLLGLNDGDGSPWEITISIERTEVIDGLTYYVFSSMPGPTPNPPHCITGKKVRWSGDHLMEHTGTGEISLYRFDTAGGDTYTIPETEGDTQVEFLDIEDKFGFPPIRIFRFTGYSGLDDYLAGSPRRSHLRQIRFLAGYGMDWCMDDVNAGDTTAALHQLYGIRATLLVDSDGRGASGAASDSTAAFRTVDHWDAQNRHQKSSDVSSSTWGNIKKPTEVR